MEIMMLLNVALMCAWPTASTFTTRFFALSLRLSAAITNSFYCIVLTLRCFLLIRHRLAFALARARVVLRGLATNRQTLSVTQAPIAADVHEAFDAQLDFRLEYAVNLIFLCYDGPDGIRFFVGPVFYLLVPIHVGFGKDSLGRPSANAENVGKTDLTSLVIRNVNTCYTCHVIFSFSCSKSMVRSKTILVFVCTADSFC